MSYGPGFGIVSGSPHLVWCQILKGEQLYIGQIVKSSGEGMTPIGKASGASDTSTKSVPYGIVVATNNATPVFDSTYNVETITESVASGNDREHNIPVGEPHGIFGQVDMVQVALIDNTTVIRGMIKSRAAGGGTNISARAITTAGTVTSVIAKGGFVGSYVDKDFETVYFVDGANAGQYRILDSASSINLKWDATLKVTTAVGDQVKIVPGLVPNGYGKTQFDAESMFINAKADASSNYYAINVIRLDLSEDGNEYVDFQFLPEHFNPNRT
jgi:hypothetical protein